MGGPIFMIYVSYDVSLRKELPFGVTLITSALNFLVVLTF